MNFNVSEVKRSSIPDKQVLSEFEQTHLRHMRFYCQLYTKEGEDTFQVSLILNAYKLSEVLVYSEHRLQPGRVYNFKIPFLSENNEVQIVLRQEIYRGSTKVISLRPTPKCYQAALVGGEYATPQKMAELAKLINGSDNYITI
jgi:hypothetical protein